ncbi:unnamed protein product, partial [Symbiodinium sp. KB8]
MKARPADLDLQGEVRKAYNFGEASRTGKDPRGGGDFRFLQWTLDFNVRRALELSTSPCLLVPSCLCRQAVGKHVSSLPVLEAYNPSNPTALRDWIAVVQLMLSSLSDTGSVWWGYTFQAANQAYVRWLATSPLERLSIQKEFDQVTLVQPQHALLEQRCVTLILQSLPDELRVDIVASRHLSVAGMIFRLMTVFQPGAASERATMLRFLVTPEVAATLSEAAKLLRQWAQWRMLLTQLQAAEPDTTLLVKGLDTLTQKALAKHPSSLFRLATFRERLGIDYAPTSEAVSELCRMLQAEVEHLSHSGADDGLQKEDADNKRQKLQKVLSPTTPQPSSPAHPSGAKPCKNWLTAGGCSYGSSCQFFHDQSEEKMKGRRFSCSAEDHWADTCPVSRGCVSAIPVTVSLAVGEMVVFRNDSDLLVRPRLLCPPPFARLIADCRVCADEVSLGSLKEWLSKHLCNDSCGELELQTVSKVLFPDLPEALASQVATSPSFDPSRVPFNRRSRRQLFDPQVPTMVHLFAGQHRWRNSVGQVLEVDAAKGADLLSDDVFGMLLRAATSGVIDGVVVACPCKTFDPDASAPSSSGLKFRGEEGEERFGCQGLSHADQSLVDRDTLLFLRSLLLIFVASCAREKVFTCLEMPEASHAWWPECENVTVSLGGWTASFDQGALGSTNHKSSAVYTSSFQLYEALHEVRSRNAPENGDSGTSDFSDKGWAPGLVSRILRAWENYCYLSFQKIQALTREREGLLLNLCQEAVAAKMSPEVWERQAFAMQLAVMRAVARLRAHVIPCFRFHSDRAREFLGDALERFLAEQGIFSTRTAPEDHAANGSSEVAIRELKRSARKALLESNLDSSHWPTAIRHVGEVAWRRGKEKAQAQGCVDLSYKDLPSADAEPPLAEESLESEAESLDFLQDPQQESPAFQEVAKFVGPNPQRLPEPRPRPNRRRTALLYVSFGYFEPEQRRALCTLQEKEFERQLADFVQMLDPSDAVNDDLQGQPEPLLEVLQHHDDDYSMYEEGMQFPDRLLVFTIWNFRLGRTQVVLLRITEARDEQPAEPVLRVPGPEPPAVMKLRIKGFRSSGAQGSGNASTTATLSTEESTIVAWRIDPPSFPLCQALYSDAPLGPFLVQEQLLNLREGVTSPLAYPEGVSPSTQTVTTVAFFIGCWAASSVDPSPPEEDTESTLPHPRIRKVDHSDRADVNAPVARWERHYAVLTDEEAREWQAGNPAEPTTGWNPLDVQNFGSLTHSIHRPELSFPVSRMAQLTTKRPKDALGIGRQTLTALSTAESELISYVCVAQAAEAVEALIGEIFPEPLVHSSTLGARLPERSTAPSSTLGARLPEGSTAPSSTLGARLPEGTTTSSSVLGARIPEVPSASSSSNLVTDRCSSDQPASSSSFQGAAPTHKSIGVNTNPEDYPPMPPILPATPAAAYRHPVDLVSHQTAHGTCWHQNPECFHLRNHNHFPL